MARIIVIYQIDLREGVEVQEFIRFFNDEYAPMAARINWRGSIGLADRGERKGKLAFFWEFDNQAQRDIACPAENSPTETAKALMGTAWEESGKTWDRLVEKATYSGDYVIQA